MAWRFQWLSVFNGFNGFNGFSDFIGFNCFNNFNGFKGSNGKSYINWIILHITHKIDIYISISNMFTNKQQGTPGHFILSIGNGSDGCNIYDRVLLEILCHLNMFKIA